MRVKIKELMELAGMSQDEMANLLWPDSSKHTRRVLIGKWLNKPTVTIRLDQLKALRDRFGTTNIDQILELND